ncbi:MAG: CAP domain-containing protein [Acidimicrobiia bacterium]|nr:CAP domain-containing protein [Acidimicrobiia bacterium]
MAALARRIASVLLTTALAVGVMAPAAGAASHEGDSLALLNAERRAAGLAPLTMHADLIDDAHAWTLHMQGQGSLSHNPNLAAVSANWVKLGENVGRGSSIAALHDAFMASSSHRGNILGDYDSVGIAVIEEAPSKLWITVVFMKTLASSPAPSDDVDPEPYSDVQPVVDNDQPAAIEPAPASTASAEPAPASFVVFVRCGASPIAD